MVVTQRVLHLRSSTGRRSRRRRRRDFARWPSRWSDFGASTRWRMCRRGYWSDSSRTRASTSSRQASFVSEPTLFSLFSASFCKSSALCIALGPALTRLAAGRTGPPGNSIIPHSLSVVFSTTLPCRRTPCSPSLSRTRFAVFREGDPAADWYLLLSGAVNIVLGAVNKVSRRRQPPPPRWANLLSFRSTTDGNRPIPILVTA